MNQINIVVASDESDMEIRDYIRVMHLARQEHGLDVSITCLLGDFDKDERELWEIPEARNVCRRLIAEGFISGLDFSTRLPGTPTGRELCLGAFEVWVFSEGNRLIDAVVDRKLMEEFRQVLLKSNEAADKWLEFQPTAN